MKLSGLQVAPINGSILNRKATSVINVGSNVNIGLLLHYYNMRVEDAQIDELNRLVHYDHHFYWSRGLD